MTALVARYIELILRWRFDRAIAGGSLSRVLELEYAELADALWCQMSLAEHEEVERQNLTIEQAAD